MKNVMRVNKAKEVFQDCSKWNSVVPAYPYGDLCCDFMYVCNK